MVYRASGGDRALARGVSWGKGTVCKVINLGKSFFKEAILHSSVYENGVVRLSGKHDSAFNPDIIGPWVREYLYLHGAGAHAACTEGGRHAYRAQEGDVASEHDSEVPDLHAVGSTPG